MTESEQKRLDEAAVRAQSVPDGEHVDFKWRDTDTYQCCRKCGHVKPAKGWSKPCRGWARVTLRGEA